MGNKDVAHKPAEKHETAPGDAPAKGGLLRAATGTRLRLIISGSIVALVLGGGGTAIFLLGHGHEEEKKLVLADVLTALDEKRYADAQLAALRLRHDNPKGGRIAAGTAFAIGASLAYDAEARAKLDESESETESDDTSGYLLAARHLEEARILGFPEDRQREGHLLLGRCLYSAGQFGACQESLEEALRAAPDDGTEIHLLLFNAYLRDAHPNLKAALEHNTAYLAAKDLTDERRQEALLARGEILLAMEDVAGALEAAKQIPADSPFHAESLLIQGRVELLAGEARRPLTGSPQPADPKRLEAAIELLRQAQAAARPGSDVTRATTYLVGVAYVALGDTKAASQEFERTKRLFYDTPEGLAASLRTAELLRAEEKYDDALAIYRRTLAAAGEPDVYSNRWFPLESLRGRLLDAFNDYLAKHYFPEATKLLENFRPIFPQLKTIELAALTEREWGRSLLEGLEKQPGNSAREIRREAYEHFRASGYMYAKLATLRKATEFYADDLWQSAMALAEGQDHPNAIRLFRKYRDVEPQRRGAESLARLGTSLLIAGRPDEAIVAFQDCIDGYRRDAAIYEARVWCARAYLEQGKPEPAEKMLRDNLSSEGLTPASREWRESLFLLGRLLHEAGRHEEAATKLEEAVARMPGTPQAREGTYLIAEAYAAAAQVPKQRLAEATVESVRLAESKRMRTLFEQSLAHCNRLKKDLLLREETVHLDETEGAMLRNAYISAGSALFELGRYDEAIVAFSDASTRFQNEPLVLEAFVQIANSHHRQGRVQEARGALAQAKVVLSRMSPDLAYTDTTNYTREEWNQLLDELSQW